MQYALVYQLDPWPGIQQLRRRQSSLWHSRAPNIADAKMVSGKVLTVPFLYPPITCATLIGHCND